MPEAVSNIIGVAIFVTIGYLLIKSIRRGSREKAEAATGKIEVAGKPAKRGRIARAKAWLKGTKVS